MRLRICTILLSLATSLPPGFVAAQVSNQSFEVTPRTPRPTVGDTVVLEFRVRLDERDLLFDTVPRLLGTLPPGLRVLGVDKLQRSPDRIFHGQARLAFYRPGRQAIPQFGLPFMRAVKGVQRATLPSDSAYVDIVPLLPAGNPALKDIKDLERRPGYPVPILAGIALLTGLLLIRLRQRSKGSVSAPLEETVPVIPAADPPTPYEIATAELDRIEEEDWPRQGQLPRYYAAVADALRSYLEAAESVPARERTSAEVLWSLPPHLTDAGMREAFRSILEEADLVKFARLRPEPAVAARYLERCRALLDAWNSPRKPEALSDALR